ncbi:hypothetical protein BDF14DRAFT_1775130 [Spinellus fusiger]|nr:hypothetical protein BDF14DRAFT_1775130 [Spinellus fusiger]
MECSCAHVMYFCWMGLYCPCKVCLFGWRRMWIALLWYPKAKSCWLLCSKKSNSIACFLRGCLLRLLVLVGLLPLVLAMGVAGSGS